MQDEGKPFTRIIEQPKSHGLRFRYECESRTAGSIQGVTSTDQNKKYPTIQLFNASVPAAVVVSCVSKDPPYRPHPHKLVGPTCKRGVCTIKMESGATTHEFQNLGIQCVKRADVEASLVERASIQVDPYQTGFESKDVDMSCVRLCFQTFLKVPDGKFHHILAPVVSTAIYDKKIVNDLRIDRFSQRSGPATGGTEVYLFTEKVHKGNVQVRFFEEVDGVVKWEDFGVFGSQDIHKQVAIVFRTPPYRDVFIKETREVSFQLRRPSDMLVSESRTFVYEPTEDDSEGISAKRRKHLAGSFRTFYDAPPPSMQQVNDTEPRRKLTAQRRLPGLNEPVDGEHKPDMSQMLIQQPAANQGMDFKQEVPILQGAVAAVAPNSEVFPAQQTYDPMSVLNQLNMSDLTQLLDSDAPVAPPTGEYQSFDLSTLEDIGLLPDMELNQLLQSTDPAVSNS